MQLAGFQSVILPAIDYLCHLKFHDVLALAGQVLGRWLLAKLENWLGSRLLPDRKPSRRRDRLTGRRRTRKLEVRPEKV